MVTQNVETDLDITNGARGTIVGITLHPDEPTVSKATSQYVELQHLPLYILVELQRTWATQLTGLEECIIPVEPRTQTFRVKCEQSNGQQANYLCDIWQCDSRGLRLICLYLACVCSYCRCELGTQNIGGDRNLDKQGDCTEFCR